MTTPPAAALRALERRIGHVFADKGLIRRALTHSSAVDGAKDVDLANYQRLEFLGDRVLALVVADMLIPAFPEADEGELATRLTGLVRNEACAEVARALDLGAAVQLGPGEAQAGGRHKAALLGDVCEAVIGAIYLDGGLDPARRFVETNWRQRMVNWTGPLRDAKTTLQEWAQGKGLPPPRYSIAARSGPHHAPHFVVEVLVDGIEPLRGEGRSKRQAEQMAATAMLVREGVWSAVNVGV